MANPADIGTNRNNRPFNPSQPNPTTSSIVAATTATSTPVQGMDSSPVTATTVSASSPAAQTAPSPSQTITADNAQSAVRQLLSASNSVANPLTVASDAGLNNVTYHFRLFMTDEVELFTTAKNSDLASIYKAFDSLEKVVIAESGVTAGFNIRDVEIEDLVAPGQNSRNCSVTSIKITIVDALGSSLMETIREIGKRYNINNLMKYWFYLELTFKGYDQNGVQLNNVLKQTGIPNGGRWIYQFTMTDLDIRIDETGTLNVMSGLPTAMTAFDDYLSTVPDTTTIQGNTIGEMFADLSTKLTKSYARRYLGNIYNFKVVNKGIQGNSVDPNGFRLTVSEKDNSRGLALDISKGKTPQAQIARGTAIADIIDYLFMHSEDAQKIILDTKNPSTLADGSGSNATWNGKKYRASIVFRVETDVVITGYDLITDTYMKDITYNVWGYVSYRPIMCPDQVTVAQSNPAVPAQIVQELKNKGFLNKHYDYLYTGLNTEVINLDIHFNTNYIIPLPQVLGWRASYDAVAYHAKASDSATNPQSTADANNFLKLDPAQLNAKIQELNASDDVLAGQDQSNSTIQAQEQANNQTRQALQQAVNIKRKKLNSTTMTPNLLNNSTVFAEDLADPNKRYDLPLKPSFQQSGDEARNAAGGAMLNQSKPGTYFASALYDQLYAPPTTAMVNISMEIRGDPYWLGQSNLDRRAIMNNVNNANSVQNTSLLPNYMSGDNYVSVRFRFPLKVDDNTGALIFRDDDVFNGVYAVTSVRNTFSGGEFRQTISAQKHSLVDLIVTNTSGTSSVGTTQSPPPDQPSPKATVNADQLKAGINNLLSPSSGS